jgi:hypothetical protein
MPVILKLSLMQGHLNSIHHRSWAKQCTGALIYTTTHRNKNVNVDKIKNIFIILVHPTIYITCPSKQCRMTWAHWAVALGPTSIGAHANLQKCNMYVVFGMFLMSKHWIGWMYQYNKNSILWLVDSEIFHDNMYIVYSTFLINNHHISSGIAKIVHDNVILLLISLYLNFKIIYFWIDQIYTCNDVSKILYWDVPILMNIRIEPTRKSYI